MDRVFLYNLRKIHNLKLDFIGKSSLSHVWSILSFSLKIKISIDSSVGFMRFSYKLYCEILILLRERLDKFGAEFLDTLFNEMCLLLILSQRGLILFVEGIRVDFLKELLFKVFLLLRIEFLIFKFLLNDEFKLVFIKSNFFPNIFKSVDL